MLVKDICTKDVVIAVRSMRVDDAARIMKERQVGDVVVVDGEGGAPRPVGIVTDRDLVLAVLAQAPEHARDLLLDEIMRERPLVVVGPDIEITEALERMWHNAVRRVAVVDQNNELVGVLSIDDIIVVLADELAAIARLLRAQPHRERAAAAAAAAE